MTKYVLRFRVKDRKNFDEIKKGFKSVETRAATEKYRKIVKGDTLVLVCGKARLEKKIKKVSIFPTIGAMLKSIPRKKVMPSTASDQEMRDAYYSYPGYKDKIKKVGLIAFYL